MLLGFLLCFITLKNMKKYKKRKSLIQMASYQLIHGPSIN